jgi:hypothetical protein
MSTEINLLDFDTELNASITSDTQTFNNTLTKILENEVNKYSDDLKSEQSDLLYEYNKSSIILQSSAKNEFLEKIKKDQTFQTFYNHQRINDFKQKQLRKFPQIYNLSHSIIFDKNRNMIENKSKLISKYTINILDDTELDIGGFLNMRDNLAISGYFSSLRFHTLDTKFFNNFHFSSGEKFFFFYEGNYLINKNYLVDYIYKRKNLTDESTHKVTLNELNVFSKFNFGLKIYNNYENYFNDIALNFYWKNYFGNVTRDSENSKYSTTDTHSAKKKSFEGKMKLSLDEIKFSAKLKENSIKNFYSITEHKINLGTIFNYSSANKIIYKHNNHFFKFGYFKNFDGIGVELGYSRLGMEISLPLVFFTGDVNFEEISNESLLNNLYNFTKQSMIFLTLNYFTNFLLKKIKKFRKYLKIRNKISNIETEIEKTSDIIESEKCPKEIKDLRSYQDKIVSQIKPQADKIHINELDKGKSGLIINFAIYGSFMTIKKIMNEMILIPKGNLSEYIEKIVSNYDNEIVNVTIPVRYLIKSGDKNNFSSIFFHQVPKTKIIGFINPIFKTNKEPCLLINFNIGGGIYTIVKKDHEMFQIPEIIKIRK